MANDNFRLMMVAMLPLDEPIRRNRPHAKPKQAKKWQRDRQAQRDFADTQRTGEDDA